MAKLSSEQLKDISAQQLAAVVVSLPDRYPDVYRRISEHKQKFTTNDVKESRK